MDRPGNPPLWFVVGFVLFWLAVSIAPVAWVIANPPKQEGPRDWHGVQYWGWAE